MKGFDFDFVEIFCSKSSREGLSQNLDLILTYSKTLTVAVKAAKDFDAANLGKTDEHYYEMSARYWEDVFDVEYRIKNLHESSVVSAAKMAKSAAMRVGFLVAVIASSATLALI